MHAKIMMLSPAGGESQGCRWAQQILTEISAAFDHTFSLLQGKDASPLAAQALEACASCQAVFVWNAEGAAPQALYDEFALPAVHRRCEWPGALCRSGDAPFALTLSRVLSLDDETVTAAFNQAAKLNQDSPLPLSAVSPTGASAAPWAAEEAHRRALRFTGPQAVTRLITSPEDVGLCLCPPYAGGMLFAAAAALYARRCLLYDFSFDGALGVYGPVLSSGSPERQDLYACSAAMAVCALLRHSLGLQREADCLLATVQNALAADGRTGQETVDSICDQIAVAGALMGKGGLGPIS